MNDDLYRAPKRYRVTLRSVPGMYAQYDGDVTCWSADDDPEEIFAAAVRELRRTSFPERTRDFWRMVHYVRL